MTPHSPCGLTRDDDRLATLLGVPPAHYTGDPAAALGLLCQVARSGLDEATGLFAALSFRYARPGLTSQWMHQLFASPGLGAEIVEELLSLLDGLPPERLGAWQWHLCDMNPVRSAPVVKGDTVSLFLKLIELLTLLLAKKTSEPQALMGAEAPVASLSDLITLIQKAETAGADFYKVWQAVVAKDLPGAIAAIKQLLADLGVQV